MTKAPLVTVVIPTFNYGQYIGQAIRSVLDQTYQNLECLIVDDGSFDDTKTVVADYIAGDPRVHYVYQHNQGLAASRNTGIKNSRGAYLQFLDADDLIEPRKLERHIAYLESHPEIDVVYGSVRFFNSDNPDERVFSIWGENRPWIPELSTLNDRGNETLVTLIGKTMPVNTPVIRKSVITQVGYFDIALRQAEDWDFWIRCANQGVRFQYVDSRGALALVRYHLDSMSKGRRVEGIEQILRMRRNNQARLTDYEARRLNRRLMIEDQGYLAVEKIVSGKMLSGLMGMFKTSMMAGNLKEKAKWFVCALMAPFMSAARLRKLPSTPLSEFVLNLPKK